MLAIGVLGKSGNPLFVQSYASRQGGEADLKWHYATHTALDFFDERGTPTAPPPRTHRQTSPRPRRRRRILACSTRWRTTPCTPARDSTPLTGAATATSQTRASSSFSSSPSTTPSCATRTSRPYVPPSLSLAHVDRCSTRFTRPTSHTSRIRSPSSTSRTPTPSPRRYRASCSANGWTGSQGFCRPPQRGRSRVRS